MLDQRGIFRGVCMECGEDECSEFEKVETTPFCGYCACPATKHKKRNIAEASLDNIATNSGIIDSITTTDNATAVTLENDVTLAGSFVITDIVGASTSATFTETVARASLDPLIPDLPIFSQSVQDALEKGELKKKKLWGNCIMQTSAHYIQCPYMTTSTAYGIVGRKMYEKYPCIEDEGPKPWSKFAKALSNRIRKDRCAKKVVNQLANKGFEKLQSMIVTEKVGTRTFSVGQLKTTILLRTQTNLPTKTSTEVIELQQKIQDEWSKPKREKTLIKFCLRETFWDRTLLLQQESPLAKIVNLYPCFSSAEYFIVEFGIMVGPNTLKTLSNRLKEFFIKVGEKLEISNKLDDPLLSAWLTFERTVSIFQHKALKYEQIIYVTENADEYESKVKNVPSSQPPSALVLLKDNKILDSAIICSGTFLSDTPTNVMGILTALIAVYYTLELNYPIQYVQAMGALGFYLLDHDYYKLGKKANKVLSLLN